MTRTKWLNRTVLGIGLASLFSDLSHETVTAVLPALLASMGVAAAALGTIEGVADGLSSVAKLYGGHLTDQLRRRKFFCAGGYGVMAFAAAVIAAATVWPVILLGRALAWVARGLRTPVRKALLADAVTPATYGRAFGFERMMDTLGGVFAPTISLGLLAFGLTQRQVLWIAVIPAVVSVLAICLIREKAPAKPRPIRSFGDNLRQLPPAFRRLMAYVGVFGAGDFAHSLIILYAVSVLKPEYGVAKAGTLSVGLYILHNVVYAGTAYPAGILADRTDKRLLLSIGYGLGTAAALLIAYGAHSLPLLALTFVLGGACLGIEETLEDSLAAELLPDHVRGTGFGLMAVVNGVGDLISSVAVGWLWAAVGTAMAFGCAAALMAAGALLILTFRKQTTL